MKSKPINIMQIVHSLDCGGLEKLVIDITQKLNMGKYNSCICCLTEAGELVNDAKRRGIRVIFAPKKKGFDISLPFRLSKILKKEKIDIVHTHNPSPLIYGTLGARLAKVPVIINTRHGRAGLKIKSFIWKMNDSVVTVSEDAKCELEGLNNIDSDKVKVLYNGVKTESLDEKEDDSLKKDILGIDCSHRVVGTISRLSPEKDHFTLIDSFAKALEVAKDAILVFIGDGALRQELETYAKKKGIAENIRFLGFRKDALRLVKMFDAFVLSSLMEGISISLLEAMATGKPVVATDVGGNPEVVIDGVTGILVPAKDPKKMAGAIVKLLQNPKLAKGMGEAGRKRVEEKFTQDRMLGEYKELYESCLNKKQKR